jgi:ATP-dependent Clp protease adaptor protein ClpS
MSTSYGRGLTTPSAKAAEKVIKKKDYPAKYEVYLLNDDYTPMDFVVIVLQEFFMMSYARAIKVMLDVHHSGIGTCGCFTRDIAETKVAQVNEFARLNEHPLLCKMKKL